MFLLKLFCIFLFRFFRIRHPNPRTFLIPAYAGLGNFIMATPMILELKRRIPEARIYLLTWPHYGTDQVFDAGVVACDDPLGAGSKTQDVEDETAGTGIGASTPCSTPHAPCSLPPVSGVLLLDPKAAFWRKAIFFFKLRRWRFSDALILFDACPPYVWWGFALAGCQTIAGHTMETLGISMGWSRKVMDISIPVAVESHESDIHLDLLDAWSTGKDSGSRIKDSRRPLTSPHSEFRIPNPESFFPPRSYATHVAAGGPEILVKFGLRSKNYVVVQLSVANGRYRTPKQWSRERLAEVIRRFEVSGETVVLPSNKEEGPLVEEFIKTHDFKRVVNIAGRTSVREVSTVIKHAKFLLVHDSGLMHIGNAHGTPLLALYGPTDWIFTAPKAPTSHILRKNLPCQPCMAKMAITEEEAIRNCQIDIQCMSDITVEEVYRECQRILDIADIRNWLQQPDFQS